MAIYGSPNLRPALCSKRSTNEDSLRNFRLKK